MIVNIHIVKTEALLLFCRDLINSYKAYDDDIFLIDKDTKEFVQIHTQQLQTAINSLVQANDYYIRNIRVNRINIIIKFYNYINKTISQHLNKDDKFNPSMLCFSLLATWFKELGYENCAKEFVYFSLYPYGEIYDKLITNINDYEYKNLNIKMIQIAEDMMIKLNNRGLNDDRV
jgi:hypothetical protein